MELTIYFIVIFIIVSLVFSCIQWQSNQETQEDYQTWAQSYNWDYNPNRDYETYRHYSHSRQLQKGFDQYAFDVLKGIWDEYPFLSFNFHYATGGKRTSHYYIGVVMIQIEKSFSQLVIRPKSFFEQVGNALGFQDTIFKSVEFSERFTVGCTDEYFAKNFCHSGVREYLLSRPDTGLEINKNMLIAFIKQLRYSDYLNSINLCFISPLP
ncbi:hypothetical protein NIES267_15440 [Calothrix parasitica NIES-267]|uniref:Uncharacterized protein n=1 Tax=Calothrix parasitica NIES-267 TaxID=1973488 RepID=A0A1Z4LLG9_9CYAN|nr:hypothetical protein NIES267_15440 [Calothrix parasitica NIES-267]